MSVCPNINLDEWKALEATVGRFEAYKDYVESGYEIRTPEEVQDKINKRIEATETAEKQPHTAGLMSGVVSETSLSLFHAAETDMSAMTEKMVQQSKTTRAYEIARKLSLGLGVEFEIIPAERATELTAGTKNPWSGQAAFYYGGKVFFVGESLSINSVLHEFAHPLVRQIQVDNPTLFNKLYNDLVNTPEGLKIIEELRNTSTVEENGQMFQEEVLVKALEAAAMKQEVSSGFAKFIKDMLYALKKLFRNAFGQIEVSKLDPTTTLDELATMLTNDKFKIDTELITEEDVVAYLTSYEDEIKDMKNIDKTELQALIKDGYVLAAQQLNELKNNGKYKELASILKDQYRVPHMETIMTDLSKHKDQIDNIVTSEIQAMELLESQASSMVSTIYNVDTVMRKVLAHMEDLYKNGDSQANLQKISYYKKLTDYWIKYISQVEQAFNEPESGVPANSKIFQTVSAITANFKKIEKITDEVYANGARDTLYAEFEPISRDVKERYTAIIENLKSKNAPQRVIDRWHTEYYGLPQAEYARYNELREKVRKKEQMSNAEKLEYANLRVSAAQGLEITPEKIEDLMKGQLGDANWFNGFLEGYMYNNDPIVGGLALYVKNRMNEVMVNAQAKLNDFNNDIMGLIKDYGFTFRNIAELGDKTLFEDTLLVEEDGVKVKKKVWTLLNPFKNYRHDLRVMNDEVDTAETEFSTTGTDASLNKLRDTVAKRKEFLRKYFHQEYKPAFYERQQLLERDSIGVVASHMRDSIIEKIRKVSATATSESDQLEIAKEVDALWREYRQLHSLTDLSGEIKQGNDYLIAQRLREYRDQSRQFYEWKERPGVFQKILSNYEDELAGKYGKDSIEYKTLRDEWIRRNTRVVIKPSWYTRRQEIFARIQEIMDTLPDTAAKNIDLAPLHQAIIDIKSGFRDEDGQPNPSEMTPEAIARVKQLEEEITLRKKQYRTLSGLTGAQQARLSELYNIRDSRSLTAVEQSELNKLYAEKQRGSLSKFQRSELDGLYAELENMSSTDATGYYVDIVNNFLKNLNTDLLYNMTGSRIITETSAHNLLDPVILEDLKKQSAEFTKWFDKNHLQDEFKGQPKYKRISVWSVVRPSDTNDYEQTEIKDAKGKVTDIIAGLPSMKFYRQEVRPEYKTDQIVGKTIDNKGNWLPKTLEDGAADDRYINKDYFDMQQNDPKLFEILEKLKDWHLKSQVNLDNNSKLYLDSPRFTKERGAVLGLGLERLQSTKIDELGHKKWNGITSWAKGVKEFFIGSRDQAESGFNYNNQVNMVKLDIFDDEQTRIPISGLYNIDSEDVSKDIVTSMMRYMYSAERQKTLVKAAPLAKAIQKIVNDPNNTADLEKINKSNFINRQVVTYKKKKGLSVRAQNVNAFIEREFEGVKMKGAGSDSVWLNSVSKALFSRASFQFFALNIPSALKNHYSAKFQTMIESAAGTYINPITAGKGELWATKAMGDLSFGGNLYAKGPKSLTQQIVEIFDPSQGRFEEKFGRSMTRTGGKDVIEGTWLYSTRKWLELQATLQTFGGMMYHKTIDRTMPDGTVKQIPYIEAFELDESKKIQLKSGIDPKYGFTTKEDGSIELGREFSHFKNKMQQVMNALNGAYAEFDQPEAQRYILFRFVSYLRRYFTPMLINRWGFKGPLWAPKPRLNPGLGEAHMGYYIRTLQVLKNTIREGDLTLKYATPEEKAAFMRTTAEIVGLIAFTIAISLLFGWDPDDDDRYDKLRAQSGPLDFFGVEGDPNRPFNLPGFMNVHTLNLLMQVQAENEQFIPIPGVGFDNYLELLDIKSIAFGPTMDSYSGILDDFIHIMKNDDQAYYTRDTGPYWFQQKGGSKLTAKLAKLLGFTGSSLDGAMAIQKFSNAQAMARR